MEQNHIHTSPEAATDEPAFAPTLVSSTLNESFAETERHARRCRHDGWTPERQARFLEALAACGVVVDACKAVGLSAQSAYAFRNRRAGCAFAITWDAVLVHRARGRLSDELMSRAMNGCIEAVHVNGCITGERHRYDNRLSMAVLTRLDRLAEKQGGKDELLRAVSEDLDDFLDCVEAGGDADAFVEARRPQPAPEPEPEPAPPIEDEWDRLASLIGRLRYKTMRAVDIDIADLEGVDTEDYSLDQHLRSHYSGHAYWRAIGADAEDEDAAEDADEAEEDSPLAYMEQLRAGFAEEDEARPSTSSTSVPPRGEAGGRNGSPQHRQLMGTPPLATTPSPQRTLGSRPAPESGDLHDD